MKEIFKKILIKILKAESRLVLWRYKPKIVAITGSVGKTSTKDAIFAAMSQFYHVRKSDKSYNSEIGLPLTILGCPNGWNNIFIWVWNILKGFWLFLWPHKYPTWLVLEVGVGKPGDMAQTASWLRTDVVVITAIGETPVHIEFFESRKHLIEEKSGLIKTLNGDGTLILNQDDEAVIDMKSKTKCRVVTYGFSEGADVRGEEDNVLYGEEGVPVGLSYKVDIDGNSLPVLMEGVFGRNHIYASLGALAVSYVLKNNLLESIDRLKNYSFPPGRMRLLLGKNNSFIIDDTYNSSPVAVRAALETLSEIKNKGRKIAILGDMLELGRHTEDAHKNIGSLVATCANVLVVVGPRAKKIKEGAIEGGMFASDIYEFLNSGEASSFARDFVGEGDVVLVKGSQGMRMERVVEAILRNPKEQIGLLVRQDDEWKKKK